MPILDDYYRILQVHFLAEPEVIESAYKRLAKKYHPDVSKAFGADARMKKINEAYETLRDTARRRAYDATRGTRPTNPPTPPAQEKAAPAPPSEVSCPPPAKEMLSRYFSCIKSRDFSGAYALISDMDKKNIPPDDFEKWQSGVARIYSLQEYDFKADKNTSFVKLNGHVFHQVIDFSVKTVEYNSVMGRHENDTIVKKVVLEDTDWRVFVGFEDVQPHIARFEELNGLLTAKSAISDMVEHYSSKDSSTGLYNKKGFADAAQREIWRYGRYGNIFSLMLFEIDLGRETTRAKNKDLQHFTAEWAGKILSDSFRKLDILGRWGETGFIVLLPETNQYSCLKAARKIKRIFDMTPLVYLKKEYRFKLSIGIDEFRGSLEDTIRNLNNYLDIAAKAKGSAIVYDKGMDA